jgi:hypothetical protein
MSKDVKVHLMNYLIPRSTSQMVSKVLLSSWQPAWWSWQWGASVLCSPRKFLTLQDPWERTLVLKLTQIFEGGE